MWNGPSPSKVLRLVRRETGAPAPTASFMNAETIPVATKRCAGTCSCTRCGQGSSGSTKSSSVIKQPLPLRKMVQTSRSNLPLPTIEFVDRRSRRASHSVDASPTATADIDVVASPVEINETSTDSDLPVTTNEATSTPPAVEATITPPPIDTFECKPCSSPSVDAPPTVTENSEGPMPPSHVIEQALWMERTGLQSDVPIDACVASTL